MKPNRGVTPEFFLKAVLATKAKDVVALDISKLTSFTDTFIIVSGTSTRQVKAIGERLASSLRDEKVKPLSIEGLEEGRWVLLDYGDVIIHIFYEPVRSEFNLEGLWADAQELPLPEVEKTAEPKKLVRDSDEDIWGDESEK